LFALDDKPGTCPYLTKNVNGELVVGWARMNVDSSYVFCYATSTDAGGSFSHPVLIPGSSKVQPHGENLPKIVFKPSGEIIALWGVANANPKNRYSGLVYYSQSFDKGATWSAAKPLVNDTSSYDQRYFDVALLPNGEAAVIWLDNRKSTEKEGSSLYYASTSGRNGFENEKKITDSTSNLSTILLTDEAQNLCGFLANPSEIITRYDVCLNKMKTIVEEIKNKYGE